MSTATARRPSSAPTADFLYLQRIGSRWYARIPVPNKLRGELGPYIRKSLDTSDVNEARRRRWDVMEMARARIAKHETNGRLPSLDLSYAAFRERLRGIGPAVVVNALNGDEMFNPD